MVKFTITLNFNYVTCIYIHKISTEFKHFIWYCLNKIYIIQQIILGQCVHHVGYFPDIIVETYCGWKGGAEKYWKGAGERHIDVQISCEAYGFIPLLSERFRFLKFEVFSVAAQIKRSALKKDADCSTFPLGSACGSMYSLLIGKN